MSNTRTEYGTADLSLSQEHLSELPLYRTPAKFFRNKKSQKSVLTTTLNSAVPAAIFDSASAVLDTISAPFIPDTPTMLTVIDNITDPITSFTQSMSSTLAKFWGYNTPKATSHPRPFMNNVLKLHPVFTQLYFILNKRSTTAEMELAFLNMLKQTFEQAKLEAKTSLETKTDKITFTSRVYSEIQTAIELAKDRFSPNRFQTLDEFATCFKNLENCAPNLSQTPRFT